MWVIFPRPTRKDGLCGTYDTVALSSSKQSSPLLSSAQGNVNDPLKKRPVNTTPVMYRQPTNRWEQREFPLVRSIKTYWFCFVYSTVKLSWMIGPAAACCLFDCTIWKHLPPDDSLSSPIIRYNIDTPADRSSLSYFSIHAGHDVTWCYKGACGESHTVHEIYTESCRCPPSDLFMTPSDRKSVV